MLNLTSKVPDSKPDYHRDPSCMSQVHVKFDVEGSPDSNTEFHQRCLVSDVPGVHVKSDVEGSVSKPDFIEILCLVQGSMLNLTSKVPDSKPDFIRDPSCVEPGNVKSDVEGSARNLDFIRESVFVPDSKPISSEIRLVLRQVHVKSGRRRFQTVKPDYTEIRLVLSQVHVKSESKVPDSKPAISSEIRLVLSRGTCWPDVEGSDSENPDFIRDVCVGAGVHIKSRAKVPCASKPDFIRDPFCVELYMLKSDVEGPDSKP
ncbi:hypothetical protein AVEN_207269-1 [Araneus ventricosus]|uniref:Uncharacterized protein n=1 Tax=Araneus ventricosus TaxID=182803 RepID=A0A4Y2ICM5_ARAVE|nr:hypothetical protein AVEN_207269-1 [Araneus ventricosus]